MSNDDFEAESRRDIEHLRMKAAMVSGRQLGKTLANIALLEDAVIIYRLGHLRRKDKYHNIPASLLVQTFMRELHNDLDRS